ncbi:MAG: methyltransferase domain-containing protein [Leptolyngbya sp. SIO1D8]|nr:methyltransferase domain-containing protein [Leptolyngbya sp. SIO1D8]
MSQAESLNTRLKKAFMRLVASRTGLKIRDNEQEFFQEVILKRTHATGMSFPEAYYSLLESRTSDGHEEWKQIILEITNNESFFFRDKGQFKLLKEDILPRIIERKTEQKTLRICSAGCSTGEEPYSIAILLRELIPDLKTWNLKILGVDINSVAIKKAREGIYRPWSFRSVDKDIQQLFFEEVDGEYHIDSRIREMVTFRTANLLRNSFSDPILDFQDIDLILCRNVFIYFDEPAIRKVLNKFYDALIPLGYLLVGHAELYSQNPDPFEIKVFEESIAYQRPENTFNISKVNPFKISSMSDSNQNPLSETNPEDLESIFEGNDSKMQEVALKLLRNLPADMKISRLGNRTASELILQLEKNRKVVD